MEKISKRTFRGIDYVQLSTLSKNQAESLKQSLDERTLIKILKNDVILNDCVLYSAYEKWFAGYSIEVVKPIVQHATAAFEKPVPAV
jgi:hypothetical protein